MTSREDIEELAEEYGLELIAYDALATGTASYQDNVRDFVKGALHAQKFGNGVDDLSISLEREPENRFDQFAIKVIGEWVQNGVKHSRHIGYVPKKLAYKVAMNVDDDEPITALLSSMNNNDEHGFDIKFHILAP